MSQQVEFYDSVLLCPSCGYANLHQSRVEVVFRDKDRAGYVHTIRPLESSSIRKRDKEISEDFKTRRGAVRIMFECEFCRGKRFFLNISQHTGQTIIQWD